MALQFSLMQDIAKREAALEQHMLEEWGKPENRMQSSGALSKKQIAADMETSIALARHSMRQDMNYAMTTKNTFAFNDNHEYREQYDYHDHSSDHHHN